MLGDAVRPWPGVTPHEPDVEDAVVEARSLIGAGIDLIRIEVPMGRELADRLIDAGREVPQWRPREVGARGCRSRRSRGGTDRQPTCAVGARRAVDRAAAERRAYVRLATEVPALGAPDGAVVAAFERIDLIALDAMAEIVADSVEPDRALADHAFAHRIARRAGTTVVVGAGPLVVAPDLSSGVPSDPATRGGRALALQLLGVTLARGDGLAAEQIVVGALPPWLTEEPAAGARAIAEVAVRRALFGGHPSASSSRRPPPIGPSCGPSSRPRLRSTPAISRSSFGRAISARTTPSQPPAPPVPRPSSLPTSRRRTRRAAWRASPWNTLEA